MNNTYTDIDKQLLKKGYKEYKPTAIDPDHAECFFQKCFCDDTGKKYFLDVYKYNHDFIPIDRRGKDFEPYGYEFEMQFTFDDDRRPANIKLFGGWNIDQAEKFAADFFEKMKPNYYDDD